MNSKPDFPTTRLICDFIRDGKAKVRERWASGNYPGVPAEWARFYAEVTR